MKSLEKIINTEYSKGFLTNIQSDTFLPGLNENVIKLISAKKNEPEWLLAWRLKAFEHWKKIKEPSWSNVRYPNIDYQSISYYSAPQLEPITSLDELDPEIRYTYEKLGIPIEEQKMLEGIALSGVALDAVFDSVSIYTTFKDELKKLGIIFCSISEAVQEYPELVRKYLGHVVSPYDNFFATLNSAVFTDGSFVYIPKGVRCPMELSTYFRINQENTGQFERTLIIADEGSYVEYNEGCSSVQRSASQLHAAVVEIVALKGAEVKYATVQNWYTGDKNGKGGIYNFVTKRALCAGDHSKVSWTQVETGSLITWKYPSCILKGDYSVGEFFSVALTKNKQQADTGSKMIHIGKNTRSTIISKGIAAGESTNTFRGLIKINKSATNARVSSKCDTLILGNKATSDTFPYIEKNNMFSTVEHEATTSKINEEQMFYCQQRGFNEDETVGIIVNGFCKNVLQRLPKEFSAEARKLLEIKLEGTIG